MAFDFDYNTQRPQLVISEYGRHIQRMVDLCVEESDRGKRTRMARAIVQAIGKLNPQLRGSENGDHIIWDHVHVMAGYQLDVDGPYPRPAPETRQSKPEAVPYPKTEIRFGHYGKLVERLIAECIAMEEGPAKTAFTLAIANQMKKQFLTWNRDNVGDGAIVKDLHELSKGKLRLEPDQQLLSSESILQAQRTGPRNAAEPLRKHGGGKKHRRNRKKKRF
ncbi:MAG: DUF4290 domain-containing protein [Flavobacteriales bacterium]|nr:DUF4290 domain-containing protein [Flavobacteriales bacterium]MEB2340737.1 DUF4290 domain-containing protein [Flavobacteriia bacterium]